MINIGRVKHDKPARGLFPLSHVFEFRIILIIVVFESGTSCVIRFLIPFCFIARTKVSVFCDNHE